MKGSSAMRKHVNWPFSDIEIAISRRLNRCPILAIQSYTYRLHFASNER